MQRGAASTGCQGYQAPTVSYILYFGRESLAQ